MTPLGVMWMIHGNYFVDGGVAKRDQMIEDFKTHLKRNYWKYDHRWIIMYPEGNNITFHFLIDFLLLFSL